MLTGRCGNHVAMYINIKSLCHTTETNVMLYVKTSINILNKNE